MIFRPGFPLAIAVVFGALGLLGLARSVRAADTRPTMIDVDYEELVSNADIYYNRAVTDSRHGLPVGNGVMGSFVWTEPSRLKLQINRVDVFANGGSSKSFIRRHEDYCCGCGFVDIDFGEEVFPADGRTSDRTIQHLSVYDAVASTVGKGVSARVIAWTDGDVMAVEVEDTRDEPTPIAIPLKMLRDPEVETFDHLARSRFHNRDDTLVLAQEFMEGDYFCTSAVAVAVRGREAKITEIDERTRSLIVPAARGKFTVLIGSAASFDKDADVIATARDALAEGQSLGYEGLYEANRKWWSDFWAKSFIDLHSEDGKADLVEEYYTYYLYVMGCSSRGSLPPKFNDMIFSTQGDRRAWGNMFWWWNEQMLYRTPMGANHLELMWPLFRMYSGMLPKSKIAARQQWGAEGQFITHVTPFNGLEVLPEPIAEELRAFMLREKTWEETSQEFKDFAARKHPQSGRWNWYGRGGTPYGPIVHTFNDAAKIEWLYWQYYEYTRDETFLREWVYPMVRETAEFYRTCPLLEKSPEDGKYHFLWTNESEAHWGLHDPTEELTGATATFRLAIKISEMLGVDEDKRPQWREILDNLAPFTTTDHPRALRTIRGEEKLPEGIYAQGKLPAIKANPAGGTLRMVQHYNIWTLESDAPEMKEIVYRTYPYLWCYSNLKNGRPGHVCSEVPQPMAQLGLAEDVRIMLPVQTKMYGLMPNRFSAVEGEISVERLGVCGNTLQMALRLSIPPTTAGEHVIRFFPAWPKEWDAAFQLLAADGFLVSSAMRNGKVGFIEIYSQLGGECRLRNYWGTEKVDLYRNGQKAESMDGNLLTFETARDERIVIVPAGTNLREVKAAAPSK